MSKIAYETKAQMESMTEAEFQDRMNLSKAAFLTYLENAEAGEARCVARPGAMAPDFTAPLLNAQGGLSAEHLTLSELRGGPVCLILGCYTCPVFRAQSDRMKEVIADYEGRVQSVFVYVTETHPTDGWNTHSNIADGVMYAQPASLKERAQIARDWRAAYGFEQPVVLDWPDNRINADYAGAPERIYVLDAQGRVTFQSEPGPYHDSHLDDWAAAMAQVAG